jgi:excisionase family DNA binding protein
MDKHMERLLTLEQAGQLLGVHPVTIKRWAEQGLTTLNYLPLGNRPRIKQSEVDRLMSLPKPEQGR